MHSLSLLPNSRTTVLSHFQLQDTHTHTHTHTYIYIYICIYVYNKDLDVLQDESTMKPYIWVFGQFSWSLLSAWMWYHIMGSWFLTFWENAVSLIDTFWPLQIRPLCCLKTLAAKHTVTWHHIPEVQRSLKPRYFRGKKD